MPKSKLKSKSRSLRKLQLSKQLFVSIAIAALVIFVIFLLEFQGNKANAGSGTMQINPASDLTVDSPFGY